MSMWSSLYRRLGVSRRRWSRHVHVPRQAPAPTGDWDRVNAVRRLPRPTRTTKVSELERRILSAPCDSLPNMCNEFLKPLATEPDTVLRPVTLLMERMARSGLKEPEVPEIEKLLEALSPVVDSVPTGLAVSLLSSIRHLRCRERVVNLVLWDLARRLYSTVGVVELRKIPNIMGDLIQLNIGDHPVFEDLRCCIFTGPELAMDYSGTDLARIAWALMRSMGCLRSYCLPLDDAFTEEKVQAMHPREIAMALLAFSTSFEGHPRLAKLFADRLCQKAVLMRCTSLSLTNSLKSLIEMKHTPRELFQAISEHFKENPKKMMQLDDTQQRIVTKAFEKYAPLLCPFQGEHVSHSMPMEQQILSTAQPGFPSLARKLISDQNDNPPVTVRRIILLLARMARCNLVEVDLPEVQQLLGVLKRFHKNITLDSSANVLTSIRYLKCRLAVHYPLTKLLIDQLLFEHHDLHHSKLSALFAELVRLSLDKHPLFKLIRARVIDPCYLPELDGVSLARVAWALSRTYSLNHDTAVALADALTPELMSKMPLRFLAMASSAFCRSGADHRVLYENIANRFKQPDVLSQSTGITLLACLKGMKESNNTDKDLCQQVLSFIKTDIGVLKQFSLKQRQEIFLLCQG